MNNQNIYNELIYLVIDGEASEVERTVFYSELADNPILQNEFQTAMKLNRTAESFPQKSSVPVALSEKLFSKAGLTYFPSESIMPSVATSGEAVALSTISGKKISHTISKIGFAIIGLIIGAGLMYLLNDNPEINYANSNLKANNISEIVFIEPKTSVPLINSSNNDKNQLENKKFIEYDKKTYKDNQGSLQELENEKFEINYVPNYQAVNPQIFKNYNSFDVHSSTIISNLNFDNISNYNNKLLNYEDLGISIEVRNSEYWHLDKENVSPSEISKFHNMDIFTYFEISSELLIGLGIRQETFYAKYNTIENNREFLFEQQPNLTNFEFAVRYLPIEFGIFSPMVQLNFGGGNYGFTYRGAIGGEMNISESISLVLLFDYATFSFNHKAITNNSNKIGFNYGINYKF